MRTRTLLALFVALGVLAGPAVAQGAVVTDSFTGSDGTLLQNHTGEVGASWAKNPVYPADAKLTGGRIYAPAWMMYFASGIPSTAEYDVSADLFVKSNVGATGVIGRADTTTDSEYVARYTAQFNRWELSYCHSTCDLLGSFAQTLTVGSTYRLKLVVRNASKELWVDGVMRVSSVDNQITRVGRAGVRQGPSDATATTGYHLDNFSVDNPPPVGSIVWKADAEQTIDQEWASSCLSPGPVAPPVLNDPRLTRSATTVAKGAFSYRIALNDGDSCFGERDDVGQGNPTRTGFENRLFSNGDDRWTSFQVYLPTDFDAAQSRWQVIAQWKGLGDGGPPLALHVRSGNFVLARSTTNVASDTQTTDIWSGPAPKNRWVKFTIHIKFSPLISTGFVELFSDNASAGNVTQVLPQTPAYTMKVDTSGNPIQSHARIGIYRDPLIVGNASIFFDGYTVGTTRAVAEANAF
jgi:hypothetical protein